MKRGFPNPEKTALWLLVAFQLYVITTYCFFVPRTEMLDEISLYNPVYMFVHYGKMTYPVHGFFDSMIPHPPTHYLGIGLLMKLGFSSFYAITTPTFLLTLLGMALIISGRFPNYVKISLLMGLGAPLFVNYFIPSINSIRPDYALATAWFAGLMALENARADDWNKWKLFLGAALLTYASCLHYFAAFAFTGMIFFVFMIWKSGDFSEAKSRILALCAGGAVVGLPFLLFFAAPDIGAILNQVKSNQLEGNYLHAMRLHTEMYDFLSQFFSVYPDVWKNISDGWRPFLGFVFLMAGQALLFFNKKVRGLALVALPLILFVFFVSRAKSAGYYIPEMMICQAGIWITVFGVAHFLFDKIYPPFARIAVAVVTLWYIITTFSFHEPNLISDAEYKCLRSEMHLTRACAKEMVGNDAFIGGRMGLWYASGAAHWFDITNELMWDADLSTLNLDKYFRNFDAVVEYNGGANVSINSESKSLPSWYLDTTLQLTGFNLTNNTSEISDLSFLILAREKKKALTGYGCVNHDTLYRFDEDPNGDYFLTAFLCPANEDHSALSKNALLWNVIPLPDVRSKHREWVYNHGWDLIIYNNLIWMVIEKNKFFENQHLISTEIKLRELIPCKRTRVDVNSLLEKLKQEDKVIRFYPTKEEYFNRKQVSLNNHY